MGGLSVAVAYNSLGWVTNLTTPYGATAFFHVGGLDTSIVNDNNVNRAVIVTEPTGDRQMYLFRGLSSQLNANAGSPPLIPYSFSDLPQNTRWAPWTMPSCTAAIPSTGTPTSTPISPRTSATPSISA